MSVPKARGKVGKHRHQKKRKRGAAAAAGALLLVPVVAAGEPTDWVTQEDIGPIALAGNVGGGLMGLTDPSKVSANGAMPQSQQLGAEVLELAATPALLAQGAGPEVSMPGGPLGIPGVMLQAYMRAAQTLATTTPGCRLDWPLLASIGRIESNHARGGRVDANGLTATPILGPVLNGGGFAAIADTDGGSYDGDARWDRAVGPMQFIPSTWKGYASDGNGDGKTDPNNVYDATLGAGKYLCSGGMDLSNPQQRATAVFRYNHSDSYVRTVLIWAEAYAKGVTPVPTTPVAAAEQLAIQKPLVPQQPGTPAPGTTQPGAPSQSTSSTVPPSSSAPGATSSAPSSTPPSSSAPTSSATQPSTTPPATTSPATTTPPCPTGPVAPPTSTTAPTATATPNPCATPTTTPPSSASTPPSSTSAPASSTSAAASTSGPAGSSVVTSSS
ncbi:lytic transglycosylase domain-containing protein [Actinokineospora iranica]|uniref:Membrane-bound lytic murein transglycosylase B n=1 Tax=Actinokineospora iranica TaxID=1271860 RepID=A0A1G6RE82_9PSEU|nr:lytic murein transglycosylase [Actinokineospora iranica]SDD02952.1 Membrane-bound lytic murein transglycosylase B [Actinokineospora iranica]